MGKTATKSGKCRLVLTTVLGREGERGLTNRQISCRRWSLAGREIDKSTSRSKTFVIMDNLSQQRMAYCHLVREHFRCRREAMAALSKENFEENLAGIKGGENSAEE